MRPELKAHVEKFGELIAEAEKIRKHLALHYGLSNSQIAALVQPRKTTLVSFADAALAARRRLERKRK